jgi:hypothetical protein
MTDKQWDELQALGKQVYEDIEAEVRALSLDFSRLEVLREDRERDGDVYAELWPEDAEELREMEALLQAADCEDAADEDYVRGRIQDRVLSVEVRSGWTVLGEDLVPEEFVVLLGTGGPAMRVRGELGEHGEPHRAWIEVQDWGTPWTHYLGADGDVVLQWAQQFYFGG